MSGKLTLSVTKTSIPGHRPEIVHRARLLTFFDNILDRKLTLVAAPAGYGKTTLLVDFARQTDIPICWLSLDPLDRDPQRFLAYLIAALERKFKGFGKHAGSILNNLTDLEQESERLLTTLVNEIEEKMDQHFVLVVDDYHFVDNIPAIRDLFSRFIYLAGENCHVVLSSRRLPDLPEIALMVARQQVSGFDMQQLAFKPEEIRLLFDKSYNITLDNATLDELVQQTEGWITGLHLSATGIDPHAPDLATLFARTGPVSATRISGVDLDLYLDQQVLAPLPPDLRDFVLKTSLLEEFNLALCEAVLGTGNWKDMFGALERNNLFVMPVGPQAQGWLRYHHIFQEFLQERVCRDSPEVARSIRLRMVKVFEERLEWEEAYATCLQLGEFNLLADLLEHSGTFLLLSERLVTLQTWLKTLPLLFLEARPALLSLQAALQCANGDGQAALDLLGQAIPKFKTNKSVPDLVLGLVRRSAAYRLTGDYVSSLRDAEEAVQMSSGKPDLLATHAEALRFKGISLNHLGRISEALPIQEEALQRFEQLNEGESVARALTELGATYRAAGHYSSARTAYTRSLAYWHTENNLHSQANVLNSLGVLYHYLGEYEHAGNSFEQGLACVRQSGVSWQEAILLASIGDLYTDLDEYEAAQQAYDQAITLLQFTNYQFLNHYLAITSARLARLQGRFGAAQAQLDSVETSVHQGSSNYEIGLLHLERGCLQLAQNSTACSSTLVLAIEQFTRGGLEFERGRARIWLASACQALDPGRAYAELEQVLGSISPEAAFHPFIQVIRQARHWLLPLQAGQASGSLLAPWFKAAMQAEARLPVLRKRLRQSLTTVPIRSPHLDIQGFGKAQVRVNGKLIPMSQWRTASVRELFFFLLSASRPLTKEELCGMLWPGLGFDQLKLYFKNNLYRLRRALGSEVIQFTNDFYQFNRFIDYNYDVENFDTSLAKARSSAKAEEQISHLQAATGLRHAPYLDNLGASWVMPERQRLDQDCLDALKQLAELHRRSGDLEAAVQACQDALKVDACDESVHRLAMLLHKETGDLLAVIWQYQSCRTTLRSLLDLEPAAETESLYRRLIG